MPAPLEDVRDDRQGNDDVLRFELIDVELGCEPTCDANVHLTVYGPAPRTVVCNIGRRASAHAEVSADEQHRSM
jgi:hypothetical protein